MIEQVKNPLLLYLLNIRSILKISLFLFLYPLLVQSQDCSLHELKQFYKNQDKGKPLELYSDSLSEIQQIILIRHGEPDLNKKGWRNRDEAMNFMQAYDSAIVIPFTTGPINVTELPLDTIFHSSLPRAKNTAQRAFGDIKNFSWKTSDFVEFERKAMKWPNMKMPTKFWTSGSRVLWMMGLNDKNIESFRQAKKRAKSNAEILEKHANQRGMVILVAHGLHNKYIKKYLRKSDWKMVYNSGNDYLSVKVMARGFKKEKRKRTIYQPCDCL